MVGWFSERLSMKLSTIVGILTLVVVIAGVAAALWQLDTDNKPRIDPALERDLFGAPVPRSDPAHQPRNTDIAEAAPLPEEMHHATPEDAAPLDIPDTPVEPELPDEPVEPFVPPKITAYA